MRARPPVLYRFGRVLARLITRFYFREVEIQRADRMPPEGPVVLAANHPQSITDALILGLSTRRVVNFVAHGGLFANPLIGFLLRQAGVIPIHRSGEGRADPERNLDAFSECTRVLHRGGCVGIFPEGTSLEERRVQPLRTGTARIALQAEEQAGFGLGLEIVPVGLSFQSRRRFRSRVLVSYGRPIKVADFRERYAEDPRQTVRDVTADLEHAIRHQVVDVSRGELDGFVRKVEKVYKHELRERPELDVPGLSEFERDQLLAREIARATDWFYEHEPERLWGIAELLDGYERRLEATGLADRILREEGPGFASAAFRLAVGAVVGLPLALWGIVTNWPPWWLTAQVVRLRRPDATKVHWNQIGVGTVIFGSFYAAWIWAATERFGLWGGVVVGLSLPGAGLFARVYLRTLIERQKQLHLAWLNGTRGFLVARLRAQRREIITVMDEALRDYLRHGRPSAGGAS